MVCFISSLSITRRNPLVVKLGLFFEHIIKRIKNTGPIVDTNKLFTVASRGSFGLIAPIQSRQELVPALSFLANECPKTVMEIGTASGGTLFMLTRVADPTGRIISLDLPGGDFGGGYGEERIPLYEAFALPEQNMSLIRGDSHTQASVDIVNDILGV